ncbi:hypothetical protein ACOMHN_056362 [Nucella lapillus]
MPASARHLKCALGFSCSPMFDANLMQPPLVTRSSGRSMYGTPTHMCFSVSWVLLVDRSEEDSPGDASNLRNWETNFAKNCLIISSGTK